MEGITDTHSTFSLDASLISIQECSIYESYLMRALSDPVQDRYQLLQSIPYPSAPSYGPLATLSALLSASSRPWPVLELQRTHTRTWKLLPEEAKAGHASHQARQLLDRALRQCKHSYSSLLDLFHGSSTIDAIVDPVTGRAINHAALAHCICNFKLPISILPTESKPVVAISLPNGPLLALTVLATSTYYTAAPLAHGNGVGLEQFKADIIHSKAHVVLASPADIVRLGLRAAWIAESNITVFLVELNEALEVEVRNLNGDPLSDLEGIQAPTQNHADDTGLLLFTSGTSGTKKLVPLNIHSLIGGVSMVVESWGLSSSMRCLNQMPLHHVGGLVRNLFSPILSGGSVICCASFDANSFWDCVEDYTPTWYYASPTMHQCILEAGLERPEAKMKSQIRLVCNAAGGLLPTLAGQLGDTFSCTVLPSYGMTECMPISTPALDYQLDRPGTSGVSVGPEICILDGNCSPLDDGNIGQVAVRGAPVFCGYLQPDGQLDTSCFTHGGWFNTGDMGYLDNQSYLYITGRSKEVINRGGELISPFEIEEAIVAASHNPSSPIYGRVGKALAFSVMHDILQEVVGICVVTPPTSKRTCLHKIQEALKETLSQVKLPVLVVYMDDGLPTNNNKILRIKLADRMKLPEISDMTPEHERHYVAACPPPNSQLTEKIGCVQLRTNHRDVIFAVRELIPPGVDAHCRGHLIYPELFLAPTDDISAAVTIATEDGMFKRLNAMLHSYQLPSKIYRLQQPFPRTTSDDIDDTTLDMMLESDSSKAASSSPLSPTEASITEIFADILTIPVHTLSNGSDFFTLGGDSMKAGRLLSKLRKQFQVRLSIDMLFANGSVSGLASLIETGRAESRTGAATKGEVSKSVAKDVELLPGCEATCSSTTPMLLLLHLVPLCLFYPMKRALTFTIFIYCLSYSLGLNTNESIAGRLVNLVVSMFIARTATKTLAPILAILFKWTVIGRYKEGLYPMWGRYHTRWWLCQKVIQIAGMGVWNTFNWSRCLYYCALGAKIGKDVKLGKGATLGEYDLLSIEDGAVLERCIVRPFAAERNTSMYLGRIKIGANSTVGLGSIVAAGATLPQNTCIGPNSSSWEKEEANDEANRDLAASKIPSSHWALQLFLSVPLQLASRFFGAIPWLGCLIALVIHEPQDIYGDRLRNVSVWFARQTRVGFHYSALAANASLGPIFIFAAVLAIKKTFDLCCGRLSLGDATTFSQITKFRRELIRSLMPAPRFHKLTELFGTHYEATSIFMRAMDAKVGKRVYWPGTGPSIQDFDLLEIGDDVVFGSRAHLVTSDGRGCERIRIGSGAMVADRVVLLPGVEIGEKTVMGSGALTRRAVSYAANTTWTGSKNGECICLSSPAAQLGETKLLSPASYIASYNSSSYTLAATMCNDSLAWSLSSVEKGRGASVQSTSVLSTPAIEKPKFKLEVSQFDPEAEGVKSSPSPFGLAFYEGNASYRVWGQFEIFVYSTLITMATAIYWNVGSISANQIIAHIFKHHHGWLTNVAFAPQTWFRPITYYVIFLLWTIGITSLQSLLVLAFLIAAKWILMGKRRPGCYSWDISPYCQRWQLYLKLESFRRHCYSGSGILGLLTGTHWIVLYFRALGAKIGNDCALFAGGLPSLMFTEPDLLTLGDRVAIDDASLVAHINTRGKFDLNPLSVGDRSVLRSGSRLLSGAKMEEDACLLEHTLVMAGDVVEADGTNQGWPAEVFEGSSRLPTLKVTKVWVSSGIQG